MSVLAKIVSVVILIFSLIVILFGIAVGVGGLFRFGGMMAPYSGFPYGMMTTGAGFVVALIIIVQGIIMFGFGTLIYLIADIARYTSETYRVTVVNPPSRPVPPAPPVTPGP